MMLSERSLAYTRFSEVLRLHGPTLNLLFEQARAAPLRERKAVAQFDGDGTLVMEDFKLGTAARDAFAGAIAATLAGLLRELWCELGSGKDEWKQLGPMRFGYSIPQIVAAAEDNARHFDEWSRSNLPPPAHLRSIKVLAAVLEIPIKKNGKNHPFGRNVCWNVFETLSDGGGYGTIDQMVRDYAKALAEKHACE